MKRAIIVHCWEGYPEYCWYPWVKKELEAKGFSVLVPEFPDTDNPKQDAWVQYLAKKVGIPDDNFVLIGHSIGSVTILRYLENLRPEERVGGAVLVAGFTDDLGFDQLKNYFQTPIDLEKIRSKSKNGFVAIHSDNDPFVPSKHGDVFNEKLGAGLIIMHAMKHFSGPVDKEDSCLELPEVVESVLKLSK